jgi:glycosyltransferase 2 family protein
MAGPYGTDRWLGRLRRTRGRRRAIGTALSGAHLLATGLRRLAGDAVADGQGHDLG